MVPVLSVYLLAFLLSFLSVYLFDFLSVFPFCLPVAFSLSFLSVYLSLPPCLSFLSIYSLSSLSFVFVYLYAFIPVFLFCLSVRFPPCLSFVSSCKLGCFLNVNSVLATLYSLYSLSDVLYIFGRCLFVPYTNKLTSYRVSHLQCSLGGRTAGSWLLTSGISHRPSSIKGAPPPSFRLIKLRWALPLSFR
jgi:hypothetical protein